MVLLIDDDKYPCFNCPKEGCSPWNRDHCGLYKECISSAIDAVPVVHGHWVGLCGEHISLDTNGKVLSACNCSRCGEYLGGSGEYTVNGRFCPSCGAHMDEKGGDSDGKLNDNY